MAEYTFTALEKAWICIKEIKDRIEKMKETNEEVKSILEQVDFIASNLERVKHCVNEKEYATEIKQFSLHLQDCKEKCEIISQKNGVQKFFNGKGMVKQLNKIQDDLKKAREQLIVFTDTLILTKHQDNANLVQEKMAEMNNLIQNSDTGIYVTWDKVKKCPSTPVLSYEETANYFILSWEPNDETVTKYEICYDEDAGTSISLEGSITEVKIGAPRVKPGQIYTMKIRGINSGGKGQWSNSIVAQFTKPVPRQPPAPEVTIVHPTVAKLTLKPPEKICHNESPVTEWLVQYVEDGAGREWCNKYYTSEPQKKYHTVSLGALKPEQLYHLKISAKNAEGWSIPSKTVKMNTKNVVPSKPIGFRISSKRTHSLIKIRWHPPESPHVTHYEVRMRRKKDSKYGEPLNAKNRLSFKFLNLHHNTDYLFQVKACNGELSSGWCNEIEGNTRIHKAIKAAAAPAVFLAATVGSPFFTTMGLGYTAKKHQKNTTTVVAAGAGGAALGTIGAPLIGGVVTHLFVNGIDKLSDQSDDDS